MSRNTDSACLLERMYVEGSGRRGKGKSEGADADADADAWVRPLARLLPGVLEGPGPGEWMGG